MIDFQIKRFKDLDVHQLYAILKLRVDVFVVEQNCPYHEIDGHDGHDETRHLLAYQDNKLVAYARLLPANLTYENPSIGRVVVDVDYRKKGIAKELMLEAIKQSQLCFKRDIEIGAQAHLQKFYNQLGFVAASSVYLEDNIPHIDMRLSFD